MEWELKFLVARLKIVLPWGEAVLKPDRAASEALGRRTPGERQRTGGSVLAADKAMLSEPYSVQILPLLAVPAPRHGAPRIHGRLRVASAVARVVLYAAWIGHELSGTCASHSRGLGW